jgi:hypothetical protein
MTKTIKAYVELADLTAIHLECEHCHSSLTIPLRRIDRGIPAMCPNCKEDWGKREINMGLGADPIPQRYLRDMGAALKNILDMASTSTGVKISFEVSDLASSEKD